MKVLSLKVLSLKVLSLKVLLVSAILALSAGAGAVPITLGFSQAGFDIGGRISGQFSGEDLDANGQLDYFAGEISAFSIAYTDAGGALQFSLGLADLSGLVFDLEGPFGVLGDGLGDGLSTFDEGIAVAGANGASYLAGPAVFDICGVGFDCAAVTGDFFAFTGFSAEQVTVFAVAEPGSWLLMLAGLGMIGRRRLLQRRTAAS